MIDPATGEIIDQQQIAEQLLAQAKEQYVSLLGPGGRLWNLTKMVLETTLEAENSSDIIPHPRCSELAGNRIRPVAPLARVPFGPC